MTSRLAAPRSDLPKLWRAVEKAHRRRGEYAAAENAAEVARRVQGINTWVHDQSKRSSALADNRRAVGNRSLVPGA